MTHPPHLPPKSCSIRMHKKIQFFGWLFLIIILSTLAGITAALSTVAWIVPTVTTGGTPIFLRDTSADTKRQSDIDPAVIQQTKQRIMSLYDMRDVTVDQYFLPTAYISEVVMLSSDGWGVMYAPNFDLAAAKTFIGVDYQGVVHQIEHVVVDPLQDYVYMKFSGGGFRIVSFGDSEQLFADRSAWLVDRGVWNAQALTAVDHTHIDEPYPLWKELPAFSTKLGEFLSSEYQSGMLFNDKGELVGFVDANGVVHDLWPIEDSLAQILTEQKVTYEGLNWTGFPVIGLRMADMIAFNMGIYISSVSDTTIDVRKGDVIRQIDGVPVSAESIRAQLLRANQGTLTLTILRDGAEFFVEVPRVPIVTE